MKLDIGKSYDLTILVNRRDVRIVDETKNSYKICCNYRLKGDPKWTPIYTWIAKHSIRSSRLLLENVKGWK